MKKLFSVILSAFFLFGCGTVFFAPAKEGYTPIVIASPNQIEVYRAEKPIQPYIEIGILRYPGRDLEGILNKMKVEASKKGGNAIIDLEVTSAGTLGTVVIIKKETGATKRSAETEGEQGVISPEKLSQEQTQPKEVSKDYGSINITTDPAGAKIFINGEFKGQTPAEISLTTGTYQLFLEHQLCEPYMDSLTIEKGQTKTLNIQLSPEAKEQK
jgi:hypothetical protein